METLAEHWFAVDKPTSNIVTWSTGASKHHLRPKTCAVLTERCKNKDENYIRYTLARYQKYEYKTWQDAFDDVNENLCYKCSVEPALTHLLNERQHTNTYLVTPDHTDYTRGEELHGQSSAAIRFRNVCKAANVNFYETGTRPFALIDMDPETQAILGEYWWTASIEKENHTIEMLTTALTLIEKHPTFENTNELLTKAELIHQSK